METTTLLKSGTATPIAAMNAPVFNAAKYKETTREQWQSAAEAWNRWGPTLHKWLGVSTEKMLELADVKAGQRILDVAAGAGEQSIMAAKRVGPHGSVLATDISSNILEYALKSARAEGLSNITTKVMDGENLTFDDNEFDIGISRVGLIYFPDQHRALSEIHRILKPGGKIGAIVYSTPENNKFFSVPVSIIRRRANLPPPLPGQPGPFSLGSDGVIEAAFEKSGFKNIQIAKIPSPLLLDSAAECVRFEKESFGALHQMLSGLHPAERESVWEEIESELGKFEMHEGFRGPCEMIVAVGEK